MVEAKYFRGDTAGGFASTQKGVFSWHNRSVVIVSEEGGTQSDTTSKAGPSPQAVLGGTGADEAIISCRNGTGSGTCSGLQPLCAPRVSSVHPTALAPAAHEGWEMEFSCKIKQEVSLFSGFLPRCK